MRFCISVCIVLAFLAPVTAGDKKRPITLEDLWKVKRLGKPSISPDGTWVAIDVTTFDMDDNSSNTQIWLCSTDGKTQKQLTHGKASSTGPIWSPDGKSIAFVSKRAGDVAQIHVISPSGGEARQLSKLPMAPGGLKWGADSKTIYCVVQIWPDTPDDASYVKKEKERKDDKVQAYIIDDALYRVWDHWIADGKRPVVFAVDAESGKHRNLFAHTKRTLPASGGSASDYDVSPDGKEICFTSETAKELGMDNNLDLFLLNIDTKPDRKALPQPRNITADNPANDFAPIYSPKGDKIAFSRQTTKFFYADRARIMIHDRASGKNRELTAGLDRSCSSPQWIGFRKERVLFEAEDAGYHLLFAADVATGKIEGFTQFGGSDTSPVTSRSGNTTVYLKSDFRYPSRIWKIEHDQRESHRPNR